MCVCVYVLGCVCVCGCASSASQISSANHHRQSAYSIFICPPHPSCIPACPPLISCGARHSPHPSFADSTIPTTQVPRLTRGQRLRRSCFFSCPVHTLFPCPARASPNLLSLHPLSPFNIGRRNQTPAQPSPARQAQTDRDRQLEPSHLRRRRPSHALVLCTTA